MLLFYYVFQIPSLFEYRSFGELVDFGLQVLPDEIEENVTKSSLAQGWNSAFMREHGIPSATMT